MRHNKLTPGQARKAGFSKTFIRNYPDMFIRLPTYKELKKQCIELRITGSYSYTRKRRKDEIEGAPVEPYKIYKEWVSWDDFLDRKKVTLEYIRKECDKRGIASGKAYTLRKRYLEISGSPAVLKTAFPKEWVSWYHFFEKECTITYQQLKKKCFKKNIKSKREYRKRIKEIPGAPAVPKTQYKDEWVSWKNFFNKEITITLKKLKRVCRRKGIKTCSKYQKVYKEISGAPSDPSRVYKGEWVSWYDFFGKAEYRRDLIPLQQLKEEVRKRDIRTCTKYLKQKRYKEIPGAPASPERAYKGEWVSWYDLFGREKTC